MSTSKKIKISGLSGLELDLALTQLKKLRLSVTVEEVPESEPGPSDTFLDQLDNMIFTLELRQTDSLSLSFSAADEVALERSNIIQRGLLVLGPDFSSAITTSRALGSDKLWSNDQLYKHLAFLESSFTDKTECSCRTIIDTFFFRSTAMIPSPQKMLVMLETPVPATQSRLDQPDTISGMIDYTAIVTAEPNLAKIYRVTPPKMNIRDGNAMTAFLVAEAKASVSSGPFDGHLPRILLQLVACAKQLGKTHIRGALTTGTKWIFVAVEINADNDGAKYWRSHEIKWWWKTHAKDSVDEGTWSDPALIAGILSSWIPASFQEFTDDQWFVRLQHGGVA